MVLDWESVQDRVSKTPFPPVPSLADHDGVGPEVSKSKFPEFRLRALSDLKLAVLSAQSVPSELLTFTR
jgi:hypothetical protein